MTSTPRSHSPFSASKTAGATVVLAVALLLSMPVPSTAQQTVDAGCVRQSSGSVYPAMAIVDGFPAMAYTSCSSVPDDLHFVRATDAAGSSWGTPVVVESNAGNPGWHPTMAIVNGRPAIAYRDNSTHELKYVRANDSAGISWGAPVVLDQISGIQQPSLAVVNGKPAISYIRPSQKLHYIRATDADGTAWGSSAELVSSGVHARGTSLVVVDGNPAIAYANGSASVMFIRATNADGTAWGAPVVAGPEPWGFLDMEIVNGRPAIGYYCRCSSAGWWNLTYVRASDATGTSWGAPVHIENDGVEGTSSSLAVVGRVPTMAYVDSTEEVTKYVKASDADGTAWEAAVTFDALETPNTFALEIDGADAVGYVGSVKYAHGSELLPPPPPPGTGTVKAEQKIEEGVGGFIGGLSGFGGFGSDVANLGDLDGDGVADVAVGEPGAIGGFGIGFGRGAVWILLLNADGTVKGEQRISDDSGGFTGTLDDHDNFGAAVAGLGDVDGDDIPDLAVGAPRDDDGSADAGAVWILFLNAGGTVKGHQKISSTAGGFGGAIDGSFGGGLGSLGDLDGDGVDDLAVGEPGTRVWLLYLTASGGVKAQRQIADPDSGLLEGFGASISRLGDLDGDGVGDLAIGSPTDPNRFPPGSSAGVYLMFLSSNGTVKSHQRFASPGGLSFGSDVALLGDVDGDGNPDLAVGEEFRDDMGAVWILFLLPDGTVKASQEIGSTQGGLVGPLNLGDRFGSGLAGLGDLDGDGCLDLSVGAAGNFSGRGAVWNLSLHGPLLAFDKTSVSADFDLAGDTIDYSYLVTHHGTVPLTGPVTVTDDKVAVVCPALTTVGNGDADLDPGESLTCTATYTVLQADVDAGSVTNTATASVGGTDSSLDRVIVSKAPPPPPPGTVKAERKITESDLLTGGLNDFGDFGIDVADLGDLDGDEVPDLAVGEPGALGNSVFQPGAAWILFLNADGTLKGDERISDSDGAFTGMLTSGDRLGDAVAGLGDLDGDLVPDLAVGAPSDDDGGSNRGAVWILFLNDDGTVKAHQKISSAAGGFLGAIDGSFGSGLGRLGDVDGDEVPDLAVGELGTPSPFGGASARVWLLYLDASGTVKSHLEIPDPDGGLMESFGASITRLGDVDGDGVGDLAIGSPTNPDSFPPGSSAGVYLTFLNPDGTVKGQQRIDTLGGLSFGSDVAGLGDLDGDGTPDLAVGDQFQDGTGVVWVLFLLPDGTVKASQLISDTAGGFGIPLGANDRFGSGLANPGDLDGDGFAELSVGAPGDADTPNPRGALWNLFLHGQELVLDKTTTTADYDQVGDTLSYDYQVTNNSTLPLAGPVSVADDKAAVTCPAVATVGNGDGNLDPGETITCTATTTVTQDDLNAGSVTNTATASAGGTDSNEDQVTVPAVQSPALTLEKTTTASDYDEVGDTLSYSYEVTNSGNVSLAGPVTVADDKASVTCPAVTTVGNNDGNLDPGESLTCTATYTVTQDDLNSGSVTNTATASASGTDSNQDQVTVSAVQSPALTLDKAGTLDITAAAPAGSANAGDEIDYAFEVTNSGNVTLTEVTLTDPNVATVSCPGGHPIPSLAPAAATTCTGTYVILQGNVDAGEKVNTATADSSESAAVMDTATVPIPGAPTITVLEPDAAEEPANPTFLIQWSDGDADDDATISLFYDTDASGEDGTLITSGISEDDPADQFLWDTTGVAAGTYFIYATIDDGANPIVVDYSAGTVRTNQPPSITVTEPDGAGDTVDPSFLIQWTDADPDDDAAISLFYDDDASGEDGTLIISGISEDDPADQFTWDTTVIPDGDYFIYAVIDDGTNPTVVDYSDGPVTVESTQTVDFTLSAQSNDESVSVTVTAQLSAVSGVAVDVPLTFGGTAVDPDDYDPDVTTLTIPANQLSADLTLTVVDDALDEDDETVVVTMGVPVNAMAGTVTVHTATFEDNDPEPTVGFATGSQLNPESTATVHVTAQLSALSGKQVEVPVSLAGTADDPGDYSPSGSTITIPAGQPSADLTLSVVDDTLDEPTETVDVTMGTPTHAAAAGILLHTVAISDDDPAPEVVFSADFQSNLESVTPVTVTAELSAASAFDVQVPVTFGGSAGDPGDYSPSATTISIPAGQTSGSLTLTVVDDLLDEGSELVDVAMGAPTNAVAGTPAAQSVLIQDNDDPPAVEFTSAAQSNAESVAAVTVTAQLSAVSGQTVQVPLTFGGTAADPGDYSPSTGTITVPAGMLSADLTLTVVDDGDNEGDETVVVTMGAPVNAVQGTTTVHTATIEDDDVPSITLLEPDGLGDLADGSFTIMWTDADPNDDATIDLFYDTDNGGEDGTLISGGLAEDPDGAGAGNDDFPWDTSAVPGGDYFVYAVIDDGFHPPVVDYSDGPVTIDHPPAITVLQPDGVHDTADDTFLIVWDDADGEGDAAIDLFYDSDSSGEDGTFITSVGEDPDGAGDRHLWDTSLVGDDSYFVYAVIDDGVNPPVVAYSAGAVTVDHSAIGCAPPASGDWTVSASCTLTVSDTAPGDVIVDPGVVLTIDNGVTLSIDLVNHKLLVQPGGGVLVRPLGAIRQP